MRSAPNALLRNKMMAMIEDGCSAEEISDTMQIKLEAVKRYMPKKKKKKKSGPKPKKGTD